MLHYHIQQLTLRTARGGRLLPWIGPALRGLVAAHFKEQACRHPPRERAAQWRIRRLPACARLRVWAGLRAALAVRSRAQRRERQAGPLLGAGRRDPSPGRCAVFSRSGADRGRLSPSADPHGRGPGGIGQRRASVAIVEWCLLRPIRADPHHAAGARRPNAKYTQGPWPGRCGLFGDRGGRRRAIRERADLGGRLSAATDALPGMIPRLGIGLVSPLLLQARGDGPAAADRAARLRRSVSRGGAYGERAVLLL